MKNTSRTKQFLASLEAQKFFVKNKDFTCSIINKDEHIFFLRNSSKSKGVVNTPIRILTLKNETRIFDTQSIKENITNKLGAVYSVQKLADVLGTNIDRLNLVRTSTLVQALEFMNPEIFV